MGFLIEFFGGIVINRHKRHEVVLSLIEEKEGLVVIGEFRKMGFHGMLRVLEEIHVVLVQLLGYKHGFDAAPSVAVI